MRHLPAGAAAAICRPVQICSHLFTGTHAHAGDTLSFTQE